jgi:hypothetical protein
MVTVMIVCMFGGDRPVVIGFGGPCRVVAVP